MKHFVECVAQNKMPRWDGESLAGLGWFARTLLGHQKPMVTIALPPDGRLIASGGEDGMVRI